MAALYYQGVKLYSPLTSAVAILPESLTVAPASILVGVVAGMTGHYRWSVWIGWVLTTAGSGLLLLLEPESTVAQWVFLNIPVGIGSGMLFTAMTLSIQAACEPALNAHAAAFFAFLRTFGQSIGLAVAGVIFQNELQKNLAALPAFSDLAAEYSRDATMVVGIIGQMPDSPDKASLIKAYNDSLRSIWIALLAFSAFCLILGVFIRGYSMNQEHVTSQGLVQENRSSDEKPPEP